MVILRKQSAAQTTFARFMRYTVILLSVFLFSVTTPQQAMGQITPTAPGTTTLDSLSKTMIPARDPVDLAQRILGVTSLPPTPTTPHVYAIGDVETFTAEDTDNNKTFTIQ